jgi:hypothetical protein
MNCTHCDEPVNEDPTYPPALSYGWRHANGLLFCSSSQKIARPDPRA